jgi:L-ascorbate metabolism protein UlaG (beta-lactamase superfamily)
MMYRRMRSLALIALAVAVPVSGAWGQTVKITPLGSHAGELCANDRALLFVDPTGIRILYDAGRTVAGGSDPRLGDVHVVLLSHAHGDHIGDTRAAGPDAGTCDRPATVSAAPNSNTAEIAAAKNSAVIVSNDMGAFLARKIQNVRGGETPPCPATGLGREMTVPRAAPCVGNLQLGGKRTVRDVGHDRGVQIALVQADHSNNVPRSLLADAAKTSLAPDNLTGYVGHANGYVLTFTNGLKVYLSGDTAVMGDMKTIINGFYRVNLAVMNMGAFAMQSEEAAFAVNELVQPNGSSTETRSVSPAARPTRW